MWKIPGMARVLLRSRGMATMRDLRRPHDLLGRKAVAGCLMGALLVSGCAGSIPRLAPPPDLGAADREACRALAEKTATRVQGGSVGGGAAVGAGVGIGFAASILAMGNVSMGSSDGP